MAKCDRELVIQWWAGTDATMDAVEKFAEERGVTRPAAARMLLADALGERRRTQELIERCNAILDKAEK